MKEFTRETLRCTLLRRDTYETTRTDPISHRSVSPIDSHLTIVRKMNSPDLLSKKQVSCRRRSLRARWSTRAQLASLSLQLDRLGRSDLGYPAIRLPVPLFFPFHLLLLVVIRRPNSRHTPPVSFHPPRATLPVLLSFKSNSRRGSNDRPTDFTAWNFGVPTFPSSFSAFVFFRALCSSLFD